MFSHSVSEIKLLDCAPAGCTPRESVHPGTFPCTLLICSDDKWLKKCAQPGCTALKIVHPALKMCTQGACLISDTVNLPVERGVGVSNGILMRAPKCLRLRARQAVAPTKRNLISPPADM